MEDSDKGKMFFTNSDCGHPIEPTDKEEHQFVNGKCSKCDYLESCSNLWTPINLDEMKEIIYNHFSTYKLIKNGELISLDDYNPIPLMNTFGEKGTMKGISNKNIILTDGSIKKVQDNNSYEVITDKTNCKLYYNLSNNNKVDTSIYLNKISADSADFYEWDETSGRYIKDTRSMKESEIIGYCAEYLYYVFDSFFLGHNSLFSVYNDVFNVYEDECLNYFATPDTLGELYIDDDQTFSFYRTDDGKYVLVSSFEVIDEYLDDVSAHFYRDYITGNISGTVNAQVKHVVVFGDHFIDEDYVETHFESNFIMHDNDNKEGYASYDELLHTVFIDEADFSNIESRILG